MYQHDARHSGVSDSKIPEKVTIAWRYSVSWSPAVADGRVCLGIGEYFYCLNASDGKLIWKGFRKLRRPPLLLG
jgi:outer membrane protein assembly factor BamB